MLSASNQCDRPLEPGLGYTPGSMELDFEALYRHYYQFVYLICLRMLKNPFDAEDLTHDIFLQLQKHYGSFRGAASFTSWLYRVAVNQVLMKFRKKSTRAERVTDNGEIPDRVDEHTPLPQDLVNRIALLKAINELPPGYRRVFLLHDIEGYDHAEIAHILGVKEGTSKSQLHKARFNLRCSLLKQAGASNLN